MRELALHNAGLTFLEMIIVVTLFLIIVASTLPRFFRSSAFGQDQTYQAAQDILHLLGVAQSNAASNRDNDHWGIHLVDNGTTDCGLTSTADCLVLYKGTTYSGRDSSLDQIFVLQEGNYFGQIDDTDFYFNKRTGFVRDLYGLPSRGLVGYWPFTASTTLDVSGKENSAVTSELTTHVTSTCAMNSGCFNFDGTNDHVKVPAAASLNITADISIAAWLQRGNISASAGDAGYSTILAKASGGTVFDYELYLSNELGKLNELRFYSDAAGRFDSGKTITDSTDWHHVAFTRSGSSWKFFLDGDAAGSGSNSTAFNGGDRTVFIGDDTFSANTYHTGYLDDVLLYNRGLTSAEVWQLYEATRPTSTSAGERVSGKIHVTNGSATSTVILYSSGSTILTRGGE
ncbi:MAG: LamG-like jellyroll fold domain-containing protein [Patescibacteria group bacterium]